MIKKVKQLFYNTYGPRYASFSIFIQSLTNFIFTTISFRICCANFGYRAKPKFDINFGIILVMLHHILN